MEAAMHSQARRARLWTMALLAVLAASAAAGRLRPEQIQSTATSAIVAGTGAAGSSSGYSGDGGPATRATLSRPTAVALDGRGDLFIVDADNYVVREVHAGTGVITTVAGNGHDGYSGDGYLATRAALRPDHIAVDGRGDLFIVSADWRSNDNRVREVGAGTGIISTVAGDGHAGFGGDGGLATRAELNAPAGLAVDGQGNLFIADTGNSVVREVHAGTGIIDTLIPYRDGEPNQPTDPTELALDARGNLFIAEGTGQNTYDSENSGLNAIDEVAAHTHVITTLANNRTRGAACGAPEVTWSCWDSGLATDRQGNLFIAVGQAYQVQELRAGSRAIGTVTGNGYAGFAGDNGPAVGAVFNSPQAIAVDGQGNLFIADSSSDRVREVHAGSGRITTVAGGGIADGGPALHSSLSQPAAVAVDGRGDLFIADTASNVVREVHAGSGIITTVAGNGSTGDTGDGGPATRAALSPSGLALDGRGDLFIADSDDHVVREVHAGTGIITTVAGNGVFGEVTNNGDGGPAVHAGIGEPWAVAVDGRGDLFIADSLYHVVREVHAGSGIITTVAGTAFGSGLGDGGPAIYAGLYDPRDVALDAAGDLFIADTGNHRVREMYAGSGIITTVAGNGHAGYSGDWGPATQAALTPDRIAVDMRGDLFIADTASNVVREVPAGTGMIVTVAGTGDKGDGASGGLALHTALSGPEGIAVDVRDDLFIADTGNYVVREVHGPSTRSAATGSAVTGVLPARIRKG